MMLLQLLLLLLLLLQKAADEVPRLGAGAARRPPQGTALAPGCCCHWAAGALLAEGRAVRSFTRSLTRTATPKVDDPHQHHLGHRTVEPDQGGDLDDQAQHPQPRLIYRRGGEGVEGARHQHVIRGHGHGCGEGGSWKR
eukprot:TRINITY_DN17898_c0_g1_i1.p1 TRINITY_DN17898_c0_g1~~TRINITY_DN17898_c0_g1_i1.p1  ORF type:complete len:139 (-),score=7.47 TRINITY_DN17898_c0_g1_i1:99-515(-)